MHTPDHSRHPFLPIGDPSYLQSLWSLINLACVSTTLQSTWGTMANSQEWGRIVDTLKNKSKQTQRNWIACSLFVSRWSIVSKLDQTTSISVMPYYFQVGFLTVGVIKKTNTKWQSMWHRKCGWQGSPIWFQGLRSNVGTTGTPFH